MAPLTALFLALAALPGISTADVLKLIEVADGGRTFFDARIPLDNGRVVTSADHDGDGIVDLFSVSQAGGAVIQLNEPLEDPFTFAFPIAISPDGQTLLYGVDGNAGLRLYSVPVTGPATASVRLDQEVAWDLDFNRALISDDGQWAVFEGNQDDEVDYGIFSVPITGPSDAMVKLNPTQEGSNAFGLALIPGSQSATFLFREDLAGRRDVLYQAPVDGSSPAIKIADLGRFGISYFATDAHVVFYRDQALYSVPVGGPPESTVQISFTPEANESISASFFSATPDGQTVVYRVTERDAENTRFTRLYSVPITGPGDASISLMPDGQDLVEYEVASNSRVVYDIRTAEGGRALWSTPIDGPNTEAVRLSPEPQFPNRGSSTFQVSPDGSWVVFQGILRTDQQSELWSVPTLGPSSAAITLSPQLPAASDVFFDFTISPDSQRVAYRVDLEVNDRWDLYSIEIDGPRGSGIKLNGPLASGGDVCANGANCYRFAPDSRRVIYEADADADRQQEVFIADDGQAAAAWVETETTVLEGSGTTLTVDIGAPSVFPVTMDIEQTGGNASPADYSLNRKVVIAPGETTKVIPLSVIDEAVTEPDETARLTLTNIENAAPGSPLTTVIRIKPFGVMFFDGFEPED